MTKCKWGQCCIHGSAHRQTNNLIFRRSVQFNSKPIPLGRNTAPITNHCLGLVIIISRIFAKNYRGRRKGFKCENGPFRLNRKSSKKPEHVKEGETLPFDSVCKCHFKIRKRIRSTLQSIISPPRIIGKINNSLKRTPGIRRAL